MAASSQDGPLSECKERVFNKSENACFILGTGKCVTPRKPGADVTPSLCNPDTFQSPLDFSTVTVEQLGITPESFVKTPSGKSPSSLQKSRRRSTVGVRGSPETNCLIRFIAQQRNLKKAGRSPLAHLSPFQDSPGLYRNGSALRKRIAAFRSAFYSIEETEKMTTGPAASKADGTPQTSNLTKKEGLVEYQQSGFPAVSSSKRRRISSQDSPDDQLSDAKGKVAHAQVCADQARAGAASADLAEKSSDVGSAQPGCMVAPLPLLELMEASHGLAVADWAEGAKPAHAVPLDTAAAQPSSSPAPATRPPVTPVCTVCRSSSPSAKTFVLRSVLRKPGKLFSENRKEYNLCDNGAHLNPDPSNHYRGQGTGEENCKIPDCQNLRKRKRVTFGEDLSPEVFDESLPPNTPLCKGGTPAHQRNRNAISPLQSPFDEQFLQPNFDDKEENLENIEPPQVSFTILSPSKSSFSETPGTDACSSLNNHEEITCSVGRPKRTSLRIKLMNSAEEDVCNSSATGAEPCKEKNMRRRKPQEKKCTSKALPKKKQVSKSYRKKRRKGVKGVEKSLYGQREIASKKPLLSPISELPEVSEMTPLSDCMQKTCSDDFNLSGDLEELISLEIPMKRRRLLPQKGDSPELGSAFDQSRVSEPFTAASEGGPKASTRDLGNDGSTRIESTKEPEIETKTESSLVPCASVTQGCIVSSNPKPLGSPQCQDILKAGENAEIPCEVLPVSENMYMKCEKESECLAPKGNLRCSPFTADSEKENNCSEDILVKNIKESTSHCEKVGRKCAEISSVRSGRGRKPRRHTMYWDGQSLCLEQNGTPASSNGGGNSVDISSQLIEDLSDTIEQSFQTTSRKAKVRRSTRLQRDLGNEGLIWLTPSPPTSQKTKRRKTICTFDRGFESTSSREETKSSGQNPAGLPSISGSESQGIGSSTLPGRRRKSFCLSTLTDTESTTKPPCEKTLSQ
ncbi:cell division cycle-associated protein 2 isoform X1 [Meriones unguiculatus]|uniref:cell division cycle-associated protein 2 isoform X1 n=1 Tax=Meriones unguiculatus TaxID=10047 RepID=UPI000B4EAFA1|nr:cell division cycle-associated protein 2 isoform X1 [Meriones unguiculatus]XP_021491178.1 cell division cycle-associated protein 2 isoform X1 [Meriones unguiculatus]